MHKAVAMFIVMCVVNASVLASDAATSSPPVTTFEIVVSVAIVGLIILLAIAVHQLAHSVPDATVKELAKSIAEALGDFAFAQTQKTETKIDDKIVQLILDAAGIKKKDNTNDSQSQQSE